MTSEHIYFPEHLTPKTLDELLAKGWYRMGQSIFTTHYLIREGRPFRVFWLRYNLRKLEISKSNRQIIRKNNCFQTYFKPINITGEVEELYQMYRASIDFYPALSVQQWLYGEEKSNVYDTSLIEIRDNNRLIAAGIFDKGHNSIAGIMNFYHPDYKKYSLGKYLMLIKAISAKEWGMKWYYPGYIVYDDPKFDYKLFLDPSNAEFYLPEKNRWISYNPIILDKVKNTFPL